MDQILISAISLGLLWSIMTIGIYISYRLLNVADLSVEGSLTTGAAVTALALGNNLSPLLALFFSLTLGAVAGLITGLLYTKLKIPALLSGILTMTALYSLNLKIMGRANYPLIKAKTIFMPLEALGLDPKLAVPILTVFVLLVLVLILYWFFGTELGSAIRATGNNPQMARAQGINTDRMTIYALVISNSLVAISGSLIAQSQRFSDIQMGIGSIVIGLASLIIAEVILARLNFFLRLLSLALGAIIYRLIIALVLQMGMDPNDLKLFTAIIVSLALALPHFRQKLSQVKKLI